MLCLGLFTANRQWDGQLEAGVNAALCGAFAVLAAGTLIRLFGARWRWLILAAVAVCDVLPFGWENTLSGFQAQNYFLIIFSLAAIWGLGLHRAGTMAWWVGLTGAVLACLSMGSGFLAAAAVLALLAWRAVRDRARPGWHDGLTAVLCACIVAVGWLTRTVVPAHAFLRAATLTAFLRAFCRFLAWPFYDQPLLLAIMAAPLLILAAMELRRALTVNARGSDRRPELLLAVGAWCVLQTAALAYTREGHGAPPACRYMDLLAIFPLTNFLAAMLLVARSSGKRGTQAAAVILTALWLGALTVGLWQETAKDFRVWLPGYLATQRRCEENVRAYLHTGDFARYLDGKTQDDIPFPRPDQLRGLLDDPTVRAFLPADVRLPLPVQLDEPSNAATAFRPNGWPATLPAPPWTPAWGSYPGAAGTLRGSIHETGSAEAKLPYLQFQSAGDLGEPGVSFVLTGEANTRHQNFQPSHVPHEHWRVDFLRRPGNDLRFIADAAEPTRWFAFTAPVEVGGCSYWMGWTLRRSGTIFAAGWALALLALGWNWRRARPGPPTNPPAARHEQAPT